MIMKKKNRRYGLKARCNMTFSDSGDVTNRIHTVSVFDTVSPHGSKAGGKMS